jgi:hypothetical protein
MSNSILVQYDFTSASFLNGALNDIGNNNYNAKVVNNPSLNQAGPLPSLKSVVLNVSQSQYISLPAFTTPSNGMSISFWFRSNNNATWARVFDFGNGSNNNNIIAYINSGNFGLSVYKGSTSTQYNNVIPSVNDNVWRHILWAFDPTGVWNLYLNGNLYNIYSNVNYPNVISRAYQYIGRSNWADPYYNGAIADFRIFNGVLSASQVTNIYNAPNSNTWKYTPSIGNFIKLNGGNVVTNWSNLNIPSSSNMSVSFTINLQNVNGDYRSIFHVTTGDNGNRIPAVWITAGAQSLLIINLMSNNDNAAFYTSPLPLNTNTKVDIIWQGLNVKAYFNGILNSQSTFTSPLAQTNGNANVYIADPWYSTGGFNIQDLTFYNGQSLTFPVSTNTISAPTWQYTPSVGKAVTLSGNNAVTTWSKLNIASNSNMSTSFTINIQNVNSNWRNIFHITNTNNDCCNIGDRVPAVWITAGAQTLLIVNSITNNGNSYFYTNNVQLNTDTKVDIVWKGQNVKIYFNGLLNSQFDYSAPLATTNGDANVYIADPWYSTGGFTVKDLTFYNGPSIQLSSTKAYNYLGCYNDTGNRAIPNYVGNVNNKEECQDYAISNNSALYGVQYYGQCFIGNDISKATQYGATSNCPDMGGGWTNQIYSTVPMPKPTYNYLGCYNDTGNRAIADQMSIVSSVYDCEQLAKQKGYSVYGLQYGGYCFGSNDINSAREYGLQTDQTQCTSPLGGGWTNQVYTNIDNVPPLTNITPNMPASVDSYNYKGCYNNRDNTAISTFRGNVTSIDECAQLAFNNGEYIFGVTNNGKCYTGINIDQALSQGQNYATAYCGTLGSSNTYQVYIRDITANPLPKKFSTDNISDGTQKNENFSNLNENFSNLNDINNSKYLYSLKILSIILIIIVLIYMMYHII